MACPATKSEALVEVVEGVELEVAVTAADSDDDAPVDVSIDKEDAIRAAPPRVAFHDAGLEKERQSFSSRT